MASLDAIETARQVMDSYGVPEWLWRPLADARSGGDPYATTSQGYGLFGLPAGDAISAVDLWDPARNAQITARRLSTHYINLTATDPGLPQSEVQSRVWESAGFGDVEVPTATTTPGAPATTGGVVQLPGGLSITLPTIEIPNPLDALVPIGGGKSAPIKDAIGRYATLGLVGVVALALLTLGAWRAVK